MCYKTDKERAISRHFLLLFHIIVGDDRCMFTIIILYNRLEIIASFNQRFNPLIVTSIPQLYGTAYLKS